MTHTKCKICNESTEGRGFYMFSYLDKTVYLCGCCAQKVMKYINRKSMEEKNGKR